MTKSFSDEVYWKLETLRKRVGMTQAEFSERCGITRRTWVRYRTDPGDMKMKTVEKAARILMVPMEEITGRRGL